MSNVKFNKAQLEAINANNKKILISAGAGAGKSGTLTERIVRLITENKAKLLQMLVITFTRDAASSIRDKIRTALEECQEATVFNANVNESVANLPVSHISTIHAFCSEIVRQGASLLKIDTNFSIIDDSDRDAYFKRAVNDAIDEIAKRTYPKDKKSYFGVFKKAVSAKQIPDMCADIYDVLMGIPRPMEYLGQVIDQMNLSPNPWEEELFNYCKMFILTKSSYIEQFEKLSTNPLLALQYQDVCKRDITLLKNLMVQAENATSANELISAVRNASANVEAIKKAGKMNDAQAALYDYFKTLHGYLKNKPTSSTEKKTLLYAAIMLENAVNCRKTDIVKTQNQLKGLKVLLEEVHNQFIAIKTNDSVLDYSDLEQYAYTLLMDYPDIRTYFQNKYKYVFVDECQDVSAVQHAIIDALDSQTNNLFYVGDIKQSIYRFRHADPMQFLAMRNSYEEKEDAECRKIFFQHNYRSSPTIIEAVNAVFSNLLDKSLTEIAYEPGDYLLAGRSDIPGKQNEVIIVNGEIEKDPVTGKPITDQTEAQCVEVGNKIKEYVSEGAKYKDIVILLRSAKDKGQRIASLLSSMHIPSYYNGKTAFFDTPEVSLFIELLKTVHNDYQDYPLIATLRSQLFSFSDTELAEIRLQHNSRDCSFSEVFHELAEKNTTALEKRCHEALEKINSWKKNALETKNGSDIIWYLMKKTGYYAQQSAFPDGELRQKNLDALYDKALNYEKQGYYKLTDILGKIDDMRKAKGGSNDPVPLTENDDFVRIMTIHASKGLEFPIVFVLDMQKNIHHAEKLPYQINLETDGNTQKSLGIYMPCFGYVNKIKTVHDTYGKYAFSAKRSMMELAEESRMLYVAMTRAMERLVLVGVIKKDKTIKWANPDKRSRVFETESMLDMVMPTVLNGTEINKEGKILDTPLWKVVFASAKKVDTAAITPSMVQMPTIKNDIDFDALWGKTKASVTNLPAKTAVSYIENETFITGAEEEGVGTFALGDEMEMPAFLTDKEETPAGAELGTLLHKFMRIVNFDSFKGAADKSAVKTALASKLESYTGISDKQASEIERTILDGIVQFIVSPAGQFICEKSGALLREQDIIVKVNIDGKEVLMQGVIDAMVKTDGGWIILDYKTDRNTDPAVLIEKHGNQLNYYRKALEKITNEPVARMLIISVRNGNAIEVPKKNVKYM